jgi:uncharacterized protein (TIGR00730 family)
MHRVCVFAGSRDGARPEYVATARALGAAIAQRGWGLVYGGASVGTMGALADAAIAAGGDIIGVIPRAMVEREIAHTRLRQLVVVESMHERKATMHQWSHAFVALPGGFGTLDEVFEAITWAQLGLHDKPVGILDSHAFFDNLLDFLDHAVDEGFVQPRHRALLLADDRPGPLLDALADRFPLR